MNKEFIQAIEELEVERGISREMLFEAIESALVSAYVTDYKKKYGTVQNVSVDIDRKTGEINVYVGLEVVEEVLDDNCQISLEEAQEIDPAYAVGDSVLCEVKSKPKEFGRIAAQTAKQVVVQKIREAERTMIYDDYIDRAGKIITGEVHRISNGTIFVNMGQTDGILPIREQVPGEHYEVGDSIRVFVIDVKKTTKGPQIFLSRSHPGFVKRLFEMEVPEIDEGIVEIKSIAREAGSRTKMAVYTADENVDPVGACVGNRGLRVQNVVNELTNEKIDIIVWSEDPKELISNVLSPAQVESVIINEEEQMARVVVPDFQLSLAIGRSGQNVRLAAKLCGWKIDIKSHTQSLEEPDDFVEVLKSDVSESADECKCEDSCCCQSEELETAGECGCGCESEEKSDCETEEKATDEPELITLD